MSEMNAEHTIRDFWATRPRRSATDRKIAGVGAALARRYAVDPVLVRVGFVVATLFSGAGILLYLLGWLLLPAEQDETSAAEGLLGREHSSVSPVLTVVLGLALIPTAGMVFSDVYGVIGLALSATAIFLLHRARAAVGELPAAPGGGTGTTAAVSERGPDGPAAVDSPEPAVADSPEPAVVPGLGSNRSGPPAWDPLSAAPFAWELPEPAPLPPQPPTTRRRLRAMVTPITLGIALLVTGIAAALWPGLKLAQLGALALGVVGLGLVVGSLVRGGRGLIVVAVALALLTWVLQALPNSDVEVGERSWSPVAAAQVQPRYELTMGSAALDLTGLRIPDGQTVHTAIAIGLGEVRVTLPPDLDAEVVCRAAVGEVACLGATQSGVPAQVDVSDTGRDGPGGGTLFLNVRSGAAEVLVERAS